jgi:hypothetical protein
MSVHSETHSERGRGYGSAAGYPGQFPTHWNRPPPGKRFAAQWPVRPMVPLNSAALPTVNLTSPVTLASFLTNSCGWRLPANSRSQEQLMPPKVRTDREIAPLHEEKGRLASRAVSPSKLFQCKADLNARQSIQKLFLAKP